MKILLIRFSSIGDIVLTTPVIRCLKQQLKDAQLHYLTKPQYHEIISANPYLDKIHLLQENIVDTIGELRREKFDCIIDLHHNQRTFLIKRALAVKSRSFNKANIGKWLMVNFKSLKGLRSRSPGHVVSRYLKTAEELGVEDDGKGLDYFIPAKEEVCLDVLPQTHREGYIAWVIGAVYHTKKFPLHKIILACGGISQPVVLLGGKPEFSDGEEIKKAAGSKVFNACGRFSLNQSASLIRQAAAVITNDTGLMHIAAAFQKPVISIWGNTVPEFGMYPYYGNNGRSAEILEVKNLCCRPCSKLGFGRCPKKHFRCMEWIDESRIARLLEGFHLQLPVVNHF